MHTRPLSWCTFCSNSNVVGSCMSIRSILMSQYDIVLKDIERTPLMSTSSLYTHHWTYTHRFVTVFVYHTMFDACIHTYMHTYIIHCIPSSMMIFGIMHCMPSSMMIRPMASCPGCTSGLSEHIVSAFSISIPLSSISEPFSMISPVRKHTASRC